MTTYLNRHHNVSIALSGTAIQGNVLTANVTSTGGLTGITITYQWQVSSNGGVTWTNISGATSNTLTLTGAQVNDEIRATAVASIYNRTASVISNATSPVLALLGTVNISGTAAQGSVLTANVTDTAGLIGVSIGYQWQVSNNGGATWTNITGATTKTLTLTEGLVNNTIRANASYTNNAGVKENINSNSTALVSSVLGTVSITGTSAEYQTLTANVTIPGGLTGVTNSYQWQQSNNGGSTWTNITGATAQNIKLAQAQIGNQIRVSETSTAGGNTETITSSPTSSVANVPGIVSVTGKASQGNVLTANVSDPGGLTGVTVGYQWQKSNNSGSTWTNITGATAQTLTLTEALANNTIRVNASYTNNASSIENINSSSTTPVLAILGSIIIAGTAAQYQTLTANVIIPGGLTGVTNSYQWQQSNNDGSTWTDITGATAQTISLAQSQVGNQIRVSETSIAGGNIETITSSPTSSVLALSPSNINLPGLTNLVTPPGNPVLPSFSNMFTPNLTGTVATNAPAISNWTQTANAGETIALTGNLFTPNTTFWVYGQSTSGNSVLEQANVKSISGNVASVTLPTNLPSGSEYLLWAKNGNIASTPVAINQTQAWWIQGTVKAGQVASVFGTNLSHNGGTTNSFVYIVNTSTGQGSFAQIDTVNPYKVNFTVPTGLSNGNYNVYVNNGNGGADSWSTPQSMTINNSLYTYNGSIFNVKNYGATGDGVTNDATAIQNAINAAEKVSGSTVYFPAGTYAVNSSYYGLQFSGASNIQFSGAGQGLTKIVATGTTDNYLFYDKGGANNVSLNNMTLDGTHLQNSSGGGIDIYAVSSSNIQISNITINGKNSIPINLGSDHGVLIENSNITGKATYLGVSSQVFINGTNFYGTNYDTASIVGMGVTGLSITNSTGQNLNSSNVNSGDWVNGRFFVDQPKGGVSLDQYIGNNTTIGLAPPVGGPSDQNSGEQLLWENGTSIGLKPPVQLGAETSVTVNSITVNPATAPSLNNQYFLSILGGTGIGQTHQISSFNAATGTYNIVGNWNILPDQTSVIIANQVPNNVVVYGNSLNGIAGADQTSTASAGVETYSGANNFIVNNNTLTNLGTGVKLFVGNNSTTTNPVTFNQISNNTFANDISGVNILNVTGSNLTATTGNSINNNSFNNVTNVFSLNSGGAIGSSSSPNTNTNVFQGNILNGTFGTSVLINQGTSGDFLNNIFLNNASPLNNLNLGVTNGNLTIH